MSPTEKCRRGGGEKLLRIDPTHFFFYIMRGESERKRERERDERKGARERKRDFIIKILKISLFNQFCQNSILHI